MRRIAGFTVVLPMVLTLSGCSGASYNIKASCKTGGECQVSGEISGKIEKRGGNRKNLLDRIFDVAATTSIDAALFSIGTESTASDMPATGWVTIQLIDSRTDSIQTSRTFAWVRKDADLVLAEPDMVNDWAMTEGALADSVRYFLHPVQIAQISGSNTLQVSARYEGATYAVSTTSWNSGGGCREARCHQQ